MRYKLLLILALGAVVALDLRRKWAVKGDR